MFSYFFCLVNLVFFQYEMLSKCIDIWVESDHSFWSYLLLSDENFTLLNLNISEASWPILISFMCSIIGVVERLRKVLGQTDLGTLDSGERLLPFGLLVCFVNLVSFLT